MNELASMASAAMHLNSQMARTGCSPPPKGNWRSRETVICLKRTQKIDDCLLFLDF